jgi:hypothetical protein
MTAPYLSLEDLLQQIDSRYRLGLQRLLNENNTAFQSAQGSTHNHQAWAGGYIDHVREVMNVAVVLYGTLGQLRPLPFSLSDALVVLFVHDLEKPWVYEEVGGIWRRKEGGKQNAHTIRLGKLAEVGLTLSEELERAVFFVEGEGSHYDNRTRGMSPLAAFCHMCDVASARLWHDHPFQCDDPWGGASRLAAEQGAAEDPPRTLLSGTL